MSLRDQIAKLLDPYTDLYAVPTEEVLYALADAILDLKVEYFDNSIATGPRHWTKTIRELEEG